MGNKDNPGYLLWRRQRPEKRAQRRHRCLLAVALLVSVQVLSTLPALAASPERYPLEPPDTSSPRATLNSFLDAMDRASRTFDELIRSYTSKPDLYFDAKERDKLDHLDTLMNRARRCLNLSEISPALVDKVGLESVLMLKEILDRIDLPSSESVPASEAIGQEGLDRWRLPHTEIEIALVKNGARSGEYLFSPDTINRIPEFYEKVRHIPYQPGAWEGVYQFYSAVGGDLLPWKLTQRLPDWAKARVLDQALWRWIALAAALILILTVLAGIHRWSRWVGEDKPLRRALRRVVVPVSVIIAAGFLDLVLDEINMTGLEHQFLSTAVAALLYFAAAWTVLLLGNVVAEGLVTSPGIRARSIDTAVAKLVSRIFAFLIAATVLVYGSHALGLPVVPLLAGLGVGGLALALAAQPTIENFIAGLTLYADRPVRVGEFCRFGDTLGTVEEIGLRSTRLRTLDHTVASIPNSEFSKARLENYSQRRKIWYHPRIRLRTETSPDQVRYILIEVRKLLYAHPKVLPDPARIRFVEFGTYSLDLDIFAYVDATDYGEFLEIAEDLNLRIIDVVTGAGSGLAVPAERHYVAQDSRGWNDARASEAEAQVKEWKNQQALYLPKFPKEKIDEIAGTLDYPPKGSPDGTPAREKDTGR